MFSGKSRISCITTPQFSSQGCSLFAGKERSRSQHETECKTEISEHELTSVEHELTTRDRPLRRRLPLERMSALNDPEQHDGNRDHQEDVDEASERVGRDEPEQPQDEEDDDEC